MEVFLFDSGTLALGGVEVPVPFFLLRHPQGDVIVDGGNPLAVARDPRAHWGSLADIFVVHMSEEQHCAAQLRRLGVDPESVTHVVQTHLHIDHTGALGHFPNATVVVHERELDLFGDGTIRLIESPGHSAGHMSVLLSLEQTGPMLLTADASDNREQWDGRAHPRSLHSREHANRSMQMLRELAEQSGALVVFGHDPENWAGLAHPPESYR